MQGSPFIRIIVVVLGICAMGYPVWRLTDAVRTINSPVLQSPAVPSTPDQDLSVSIQFAHPPDSFMLSSLGKPLLSGGKATSFQGTWKTLLPKEGQDLLLKVRWPPGTPRTAVEVQIDAADGHSLVDQTFWSDHPLTTIITVMPGTSIK